MTSNGGWLLLAFLASGTIAMETATPAQNAAMTDIARKLTGTDGRTWELRSNPPGTRPVCAQYGAGLRLRFSTDQRVVLQNPHGSTWQDRGTYSWTIAPAGGTSSANVIHVTGIPDTLPLAGSPRVEFFERDSLLVLQYVPPNKPGATMRAFCFRRVGG